MRGRGDTDGGVAHGGSDLLFERWCGHDHRDLILQARLRPLLEEGDAGAARMELEHGVRLVGADAGDLGGEVGLVEAGVDFLDDGAIVHALEAGQRILASLIVRRQQNHLLVAELLGERAGGFMQVVVLPARHIVILVAGLAGKVRWARVRAHIDAAGFQDRGDDCNRDIGKDDAGEKFHLLAFEPLVDDLLGVAGLQLVVLDEWLNWNASELATFFRDGEQDAVAHVLSEIAAGRRQGRDNAELYGRLLGADAGRGREEGGAGERQGLQTHGVLLIGQMQG